MPKVWGANTAHDNSSAGSKSARSVLVYDAAKNGDQKGKNILPRGWNNWWIRDCFIVQVKVIKALKV